MRGIKYQGGGLQDLGANHLFFRKQDSLGDNASVLIGSVYFNMKGPLYSFTDEK